MNKDQFCYKRRDCSVSVVVPAKDEAGNIFGVVERMPSLGTHTEIIFVDGCSTDGTREQIHKVMKAYPKKDIKFMTQSGTGKANAVFEAFDAAQGDLLIILDSDLTVAPEELSGFYEPYAEGRADFLNGCRFVYPMEKGAMRFLNWIANHFFAMSLSAVLGFRIKDTLCGTKAIGRKAYFRLKEVRADFGQVDPFGDFDLIFGAAELSLTVLDIPVRYRARQYGDIKIRRFRDGFRLLKMLAVLFERKVLL